MFDIISTAPYFASGFLDPQVKSGPRPPVGGTSTLSSIVSIAGSTPASYSIGYTYEGDALKQIAYPDSFTVTYGYDPIGRPTTVSKVGGATYATLTYNLAGRIKTVTYGNGLASTYNYDNLGRTDDANLVDNGITRLFLDYSYHPTQRTLQSVVGSIRESGANGNDLSVNELYGYDGLKRLTSASLTLGSTTTTFSYTYDNLGNRNQQVVNGQSTSYSYNLANDRLTSKIDSGTTSYSYDLAGSLIQKSPPGGASALWYYTYNPPGNLVKVKNGSTTKGIYAYDGLGRRVESIEGSSTTFYAYLGTETLYEKAGTASTDYLYAAGMRVAKISGSTVNYYHEDHLGSTRLVTASDRSIVSSDSYRPFGQDNAAQPSSEIYKFTGKPYSSNTQLYYNLQRWYDPSDGRFISEDPIGGFILDPQTHNPYSYVLNSPTELTDPAGLTPNYVGYGACAPGYDCWEMDPNNGLLIIVSMPEIHTLGRAHTLIGLRSTLTDVFYCRQCESPGASRNREQTVPKEETARTKVQGFGELPRKGRVAIVGEKMRARVEPYTRELEAKGLRVETFKPTAQGLSKEQLLNENRNWIRNLMSEGVPIIDIGPSRANRNYPNPSSDFYAMELRELAGYWNYRRVLRP